MVTSFNFSQITSHVVTGAQNAASLRCIHLLPYSTNILH